MKHSLFQQSWFQQFWQVIRSITLIITFWQLTVWALEPPRYILPSPHDVGLVFGRQGWLLAEQCLVTTIEALLGFAIGSLFGMAAAFMMCALPRFGNLAWPILMVLQCFPAFILGPLLVLWFGFGMASKIAMITLVIFFPVMSSFHFGMRRTEQHFMDAAALTEASHFQILWLITAPLALPSLISGLRISAVLAPLGAVIGEWVGASAGLGFVMIQANARMQTDTVFAAMLLIALMTISLKTIIDSITSPLAHWARDTQSTYS